MGFMHYMLSNVVTGSIELERGVLRGAFGIHGVHVIERLREHRGTECNFKRRILGFFHYIELNVLGSIEALSAILRSGFWDYCSTCNRTASGEHGAGDWNSERRVLGFIHYGDSEI